jgi:hypothetical protein
MARKERSERFAWIVQPSNGCTEATGRKVEVSSIFPGTLGTYIPAEHDQTAEMPGFYWACVALLGLALIVCAVFAPAGQV